MRAIFPPLAAASIALIALSSPAAAKDNLIFYEGNNCSQDVLFKYDGRLNASKSCKTRGSRCRGNNDEARSLFIRNEGGRKYVIDLFDSPNDTDFNRPTDDATRISVDPQALSPSGHCVGSFQKLYIVAPIQAVPAQGLIENVPGVRVNSYYRNGIDGKVSRIIVRGQ